MKKVDPYVSALDEHLKFESLLGDLSANLVNLPLECIDAAIESSMKNIVEFFEADRCHLGTFSGDHSRIIVSHFFTRPGIDIPQITDVGDNFFSFIYKSINKGKTIAIENLRITSRGKKRPRV